MQSIEACPQSLQSLFNLQTSINVDGFRSLREGERVEFDLEISEDGRAKAMNVTGPGGEAPQASHKSLPILILACCAVSLNTSFSNSTFMPI